MQSGGFAIARHDAENGRAALRAALHRGAPIAALLAGIAGVLHEAAAGRPPCPCTVFHTMFGIALLAAVGEEFHWSSKGMPAMAAREFAAVSSGLSRRVYLLLYILAAVSQAGGIAACAWPGLGLKSVPPAALQSYMLVGVLALVVIRLMAAALSRAAAAGSRSRAAAGRGGPEAPLRRPGPV